MSAGGANTPVDLRRLRRAPGRGILCLCLQFEGVLVCVCVDSCLSLFLWLAGWLFVSCVNVCLAVFVAVFSSMGKASPVRDVPIIWLMCFCFEGDGRDGLWRPLQAAKPIA